MFMYWVDRTDVTYPFKNPESFILFDILQQPFQ